MDPGCDTSREPGGREEAFQAGDHADWYFDGSRGEGFSRIEDAADRRWGNGVRLGEEVHPDTQGLKRLCSFRDTHTLGGVHEPAEPAQHRDERVCGREGGAGGGGAEDHVVQILDEVEAARPGRSVGCLQGVGKELTRLRHTAYLMLGERKKRAQWPIILVNNQGAWESPKGSTTNL